MMPAEVKSSESDPVNGKLLRSGVEGGNMLCHTVILKHVQQSCFACIVQSQEQQFPRLLPETEVAQGPGDPLPKKHDGANYSK